MTARLIEPDDTQTPGRFTRVVEIDASAPDSEYVFIETVRPMGGGEERHCFALDRAEFIAAVKAEFGLIDPLEALLA